MQQLQDANGFIVPLFHPTHPTHFQIGDVYGELRLFRAAGSATIIRAPSTLALNLAFATTDSYILDASPNHRLCRHDRYALLMSVFFRIVALCYSALPKSGTTDDLLIFRGYCDAGSQLVHGSHAILTDLHYKRGIANGVLG